MNTDPPLITIRTLFIMLGLLVPVCAQIPFDSGSDESDESLSITGDTELPLPPDGVFNFTTVDIAPGATLTFAKNANNTPVIMLCSGDVTIGGVIELSGTGSPGNGLPGNGGPGGFDGGHGVTLDAGPGGGQGPGAGKPNDPAGGAAAFRTAGFMNAENFKGTIYGNGLLFPVVGGSGAGGGTHGGAGGGGAILIASNTSIQINSPGGIVANGGPTSGRWFDNGGSGGSIRMVAPSVGGTGQLSVSGAQITGAAAQPAYSGHGRIRIDALDRSSLNYSFGTGSAPSFGTFMLARLAPMPSLDIVEAGGNSITPGSAPVSYILPVGSDPNIDVKVRATGFNTTVPVVLYATPDSGERTAYAATIDNTTTNPAETTITVNLPTNQRVTLQVFAGTDLPPVP